MKQVYRVSSCPQIRRASKQGGLVPAAIAAHRGQAHLMDPAAIAHAAAVPANTDSTGALRSNATPAQDGE